LDSQLVSSVPERGRSPAPLDSQLVSSVPEPVPGGADLPVAAQLSIPGCFPWDPERPGLEPPRAEPCLAAEAAREVAARAHPGPGLPGSHPAIPSQARAQQSLPWFDALQNSPPLPSCRARRLNEGQPLLARRALHIKPQTSPCTFPPDISERS